MQYIEFSFSSIASDQVSRNENDEEIEKMVQDLVQVLKKAKNLSNALRWKVMALTKGEYLHNDFFVLRQNLNSSIFPCLFRIRKIHIPALIKIRGTQ